MEKSDNKENIKIKKSENNTYSFKIRLQNVVYKAGNITAAVYFLIMAVIYPFYIRDGYYEIGEVKYYFFRNISIFIILSALIITAGLSVLRINKNYITELHKNVSATDWFVCGYLIILLVSYIFTSYKTEGFCGADGWYMGLVSQLLFIGIYFLFSRYFIWNIKALYIMMLSSGVIFLLGILNRYSVYPINMSGQTPGFISTLGNINWFCGYWAVICPLGIVFYWKSENIWQRAAGGIYTLIGFIIGVVQGSSSAYLALAGLFVFLFSLSFSNNRAMYRFLQICLLFCLSCQLARLFRYLPGLTINYENELGLILTDTNLTLYIGIIAVIITAVFHYIARNKGGRIERHKNIRNVVLIIIAAAAAAYILILLLNSNLPQGIFGLSGVSLFTFNDEWASYRGATWSIGIWAYRSMPPLYKLIGIGPDCFAEYVYTVPDLAEHVYMLFGNSRLTNAHNEWLTILVNQGALGLICYMGIFVTAFARFMKRAEKEAVLYCCAAAILLYTIHNMVSFQQVLNAPFVFIILGIGEGISRNMQKDAERITD